MGFAKHPCEPHEPMSSLKSKRPSLNSLKAFKGSLIDDSEEDFFKVLSPKDGQDALVLSVFCKFEVVSSV